MFQAKLLKNLYKKIKEAGKFAIPIATSLFFISIVVIIVYFTIFNKINLYVSLINNFAVSKEVIKKSDIKYDKLSKKLLSYPHYGDVYGTIKLPDINREMPLYHGDGLDLIQYGAGHYSGSYFPGEGGSIVIAAHNSDEFFMHLPELPMGSIVTIETSYGTFNYKAYETKIIGDHENSALPIQNNEEILMLYTCWPVNFYGFKDKRYVVYLKLVGEQDEK